MRRGVRAAFLGGCLLVLALEARSGLSLVSAGWHGPYEEAPAEHLAGRGSELPPSMPALTLLAHAGAFTLVPR